MFQPKDTWKIENSAVWFPYHFWFDSKNSWNETPGPFVATRNSTKQASMSSISDSTDTSRLREGSWK